MERREFLGWVGNGAIASWRPLAIAACTPQQTRDRRASVPGFTPDSDSGIPDTTPVADEFIAIGLEGLSVTIEETNGQAVTYLREQD